MRRPVLAALSALALTAAGAAPAAAAATQVRDFTPFAADGSLARGLRVSARGGATCETGSFVVPGIDAFRCADGVIIRDPCFADVRLTVAEGRPVVVCLQAPWRRAGVRLRLDATPSSAGGARPGDDPWALRLASGRRCVHAQGAAGLVRGLHLTYRCDGGRLLFGAFSTSGDTLRIRQASSPAARDLRSVPVGTAWT